MTALWKWIHWDQTEGPVSSHILTSSEPSEVFKVFKSYCIPQVFCCPTRTSSRPGLLKPIGFYSETIQCRRSPAPITVNFSSNKSEGLLLSWSEGRWGCLGSRGTCSHGQLKTLQSNWIKHEWFVKGTAGVGSVASGRWDVGICESRQAMEKRGRLRVKAGSFSLRAGPKIIETLEEN